MADDTQVETTQEAPLSAEAGEDIIAAEMASAARDYGNPATATPAKATPKPVEPPFEVPPEVGADGKPEKVDKPAKPGEKTPEASADAITAAAQTAIQAEQDRQNAETVAAAARKLQEQQAAEAQKAAAASGSPTTLDVQAALKEIVDGAEGVTIPDVDDDGRPTQRSLKDWVGTYPGITQVAALMASKLAEKIAEKRFGDIQAQLHPLVQAQQQATMDAKRGEVYAALAKPELGAHEDAKEIVESKEYLEVLEKAPDVIKTCAESWDPAMQKLALEWYKAKKGIKSATVRQAEATHRKAQVTAAAGLRSTGKPVVRAENEISDEEAAELLRTSMEEGRKG
jgi:hypothetical protein